MNEWRHKKSESDKYTSRLKIIRKFSWKRREFNVRISFQANGISAIVFSQWVESSNIRIVDDNKCLFFFFPPSASSFPYPLVVVHTVLYPRYIRHILFLAPSLRFYFLDELIDRAEWLLRRDLFRFRKRGERLSSLLVVEIVNGLGINNYNTMDATSLTL